MAMRLNGAIGFALAVGLSGCGDTDGGANVIYGDEQDLGAGSIRSYIAIGAGGAPTSVGVELSFSALSDLPLKRNNHSRCFDFNGDGVMTAGEECEGDEERKLAMPAEAEKLDLPFKWAGINFHPEGHIPPNWEVPHFDFHFYMIEQSLIDSIGTGRCGMFIDCEDFTRATLPVPAQFVPANYINIDAALPAMGNHLIDSTSPQWTPPFEAASHVFIYGAFDGRIIFLEPMITMEILASKPNSCFAIGQPSAVEVSGYYPAVYCAKYDAKTDVIRISLEDLTYRAAN